MRIVQITSHLNVGGVASHVCTLAKAFKRRGHRLLVISGGGQWEQSLKDEGIEHWQMPLHTSAEFGLSVWKAKREIAQRLAGYKPDILHAHTRVAQVVADSVSKRCSVPYVATWHGFFRPNWGRFFWPCTGARTIAISEPVKEHLIADFGMHADKIRMIAHGIDVSQFQAAPAEAQQHLRRHLNIPEGAKVAGTVARLVASKGVDKLIIAFTEVVRQQPGAHLLIVGSGEAREILEQVADVQGIKDKVHFSGALSATQAALAMMDVFVFLPADKEGFGLSLLEAMASAKPIVALRRGGGSTWLLDKAKVGKVVPSDDIAALAQAIRAYFLDPSGAAASGAQARAVAIEQYSIDRMIEATLAVYAELVPQQR